MTKQLLNRYGLTILPLIGETALFLSLIVLPVIGNAQQAPKLQAAQQANPIAQNSAQQIDSARRRRIGGRVVHGATSKKGPKP